MRKTASLFLLVVVSFACLICSGSVSANIDEFIQAKKLLASDGAESDQFGQSISISGDLVVVGASNDGNDPDSAISGTGAAYIFYRNQGGSDNWGQVKKIMGSDGEISGLFGQSVSISGDLVVVGAFGEGLGVGAAYIFYRNQGGSDNWGQVKKITASDSVENDSFGCSVSISGDLVVVGALNDGNDPDSGISGTGAAYIFYRNQGGSDNWGQVKKVTASDGAAEDQFGISVSISGDLVVVGAQWDDDNGNNSGAAYIFYRNQGGSDNWGQVKKVTASDGAAEDKFGYSVSISGDVVVVGASNDGNDPAPDPGISGTGAAYIFYRNQGGSDNWGQVKKITASDGVAGDYFGYSVSISGDLVAVGALGEGLGVGSAYIFYRNQGGSDNWGQVKKVTASDGAADDQFGEFVSISGDVALVGAFYDDDNGFGAGSAYLFQGEEEFPWVIFYPAFIKKSNP